jgi:hypothetical protein
MTRDDVIKAWNNQADKHNRWSDLGEDEMLEFAMQLERDACAKVCEDAERYRWLRDNNASFSWNPSRYNQEIISGFAAFGTGYCGFEFEAAVDKARGEK